MLDLWPLFEADPSVNRIPQRYSIKYWYFLFTVVVRQIACHE